MNLNYIIEDIVKKYEDKQINVSVDENLEINIRTNSIKRCLTYLIDIVLAYGKNVEIISNKTSNNTTIIIIIINIISMIHEVPGQQSP